MADLPDIDDADITTLRVRLRTIEGELDVLAPYAFDYTPIGSVARERYLACRDAAASVNTAIGYLNGAIGAGQ